jgi:Ca2+-binding RTX toxin-like protein
VDPVTGVRSTVSSNSSPPPDDTCFADAYNTCFAEPVDAAYSGLGAKTLQVSDFRLADGNGGVIRVYLEAGPNNVAGARILQSDNSDPPGAPRFANPDGLAIAGPEVFAVNRSTSYADTEARGSLIQVGDEDTGRTTVSDNDIGDPNAPEFDSPTDVVPDALSDSFFVSNPAQCCEDPGVLRVDAQSGARTTLTDTSTGGGPALVQPVSLAQEADGSILVADTGAFLGGGLIRVDRTTGARSTVSSNASPQGGPSFAAPLGIAVEGDGDILVADGEAFGGTGGVIRVDAKTGVRTGVSSNTSPVQGPSFVEPISVVVEPTYCRGRPTTVVGTLGGKVIEGTPRADVIATGAGPDEVHGGAGRDFICGQTGRDILRGGRGNDVLLGGPHRDILRGGRGHDRCRGGGSRDGTRRCERETRIP